MLKFANQKLRAEDVKPLVIYPVEEQGFQRQCERALTGTDSSVVRTQYPNVSIRLVVHAVIRLLPPPPFHRV